MKGLFEQLQRDSLLMAYASTGQPHLLKQLEKLPKDPMGFNDPVHLPKPRPTVPPATFDVWDDDLMRDCIGGRLTKPVAALLQAYEGQAGPSNPEDIRALVKDLREAVKDEFEDL